MTEEPVSLSVVIPARDEARIIGDCLQALTLQSDPADEIIVVDNGSSDATAEIARAHAGVVVVSEPRPGITFARNAGFDASTCDVIARIDADTIVTPGWARAIRHAFAADAAPAALSGPAGFTRLSSGDRVVGRGAYSLIKTAHEVLIGNGPVLYGHNMALRRDAWRRIRDIVTTGDHVVSEDLDVTFALQHSGLRIGYEPEMLVTIAVERTLRYEKLVRYRRTNRMTTEKYRRRRFETAA